MPSARHASLKASEAFLLLCRCLRFDHGEREGLHRALSAPQMWPVLLAQAIDHMVAPLLHRRLRDLEGLRHAPAECATLLRDCDLLNACRNARLRDQLLEVGDVTADQGTALVVLKGGVALFDGPDKTPLPCMMTDLDVLVPARGLPAVAAALSKLGYSVIEGAGGSHSLCMRHPERTASLDIHHDLGPQLRFLPVADAVARSEPIGVATLRRLCPTDRVIHNIYHSQVQDRRHRLRRISLQQLTNFHFILQEHGDRIDWEHVRRTFAGCERSQVLATYVHLANSLLGASIPAAPSIRERLELQLILFHMDSRLAREALTFWAIATKKMDRDRIEFHLGRQLSGFELSVRRGAIASQSLNQSPRELLRKLTTARRSRNEEVRC